MNLPERPIYSNASQMLGMTITAADPGAGRIEAEFTAVERFLNFTGSIHGGILVAMLDDLMGYALGITLPAGRFAATGNLNASFLRPAPVGSLRGKGEILKQDGDVWHLAAKLYSDTGDLVAAATAKSKLLPGQYPPAGQS